jgi:23S rRNA pseudouridine1911/1915/1917 synthase
MPRPSQTLHARAGQALAGLRLDQALAQAVPALSRSRLKALIRAGAVLSGGQPLLDPAARVSADQTFDILLPEAEPAGPEAQALALSVIHEDEDLLVLDKPAGLVVHPAAGHRDGTLVNALLAHCGERLSGIGGVARPGIVHRLDKDTSGLMVVAKTDRAYRALQGQFADRSLWRRYFALVRGVPVPPQGVIDRPVGRSPHDRKRMAVTPAGRPAVTRYRLERRFGDRAAALSCRLDTGRTHQIRVHLAAIGHPVLGDPVYGRRTHGLDAGFPRQALHAIELGFAHPADGRACRFESPLPVDIQGLVHHLQGFPEPAPAR